MRADPREKSGRVLYSGKHFFLKLAADSLRHVRNCRDKDGVFLYEEHSLAVI